jgi:hypothetical protein
MDFICPTCGNRLPRDLDKVISHTEDHIVEAIKQEHPDWSEKDGICRRCYEYFKSQFPPKS